MSLKVNIAANIMARLWTALMSFAFIPLYILFLGMEGYGLIGLFTALLGIFGILDLGLSLTVNREMARRGDGHEDRSEARSLLRTLELVYWIIGGGVGLVVFFAATPIAERWVNPTELSAIETEHAIRLMSIALLLRWPVPLYLGALLGRRRQVLANAITSVGATVAGGGAVLVLWLISPRVEAFFAWQILAFAMQILALRFVCWRELALTGVRPHVNLKLLGRSAGFSAGITGITLLAVILAQLDKVLLIRLLPLEAFGHYALAVSIAGILHSVGSTVETAVFPALSAAVARNDDREQRELYHKASQALAVLLFPAAVTLALFSRELLSAYLQDANVVEQTWRLLSVLVIGYAFLTAVYLPLSLQLAHGWTLLSLYKNAIAVVLYVPLLFVLVARYGAIGAALTWVVLTTGYFLFEVPIMHRRLLRGEMWRWYLVDIGRPLAISLVVLGATRQILPDTLPLFLQILIIALGGGLAVLLSALAAPMPRSVIASWWCESRNAGRLGQL